VIAAIVVAYNATSTPDALWRVLAGRCRLIIVDNSTKTHCRQQLRDWANTLAVDLVDMRGNAGIAAAQNAGIARAREIGASVVMFFDQDSLVDEHAIDSLAAAITSGGTSVHCLLPGAYSTDHVASLPIRDLMSSGSGCPLSVFEIVGEFEADLFIDCVDFEWGWRCRSHGIPLVGLRVGTFRHTLGKSSIRALGMVAHIDSPVRGYYQFRNVTAMMLRRYVPPAWKAAQCVRSAGKLLLLVIHSDDRPTRLRMVARGIRDGLSGHLGPCVVRAPRS